MPSPQNIENNKSMTKQKLLEHLQDIEWDDFEVKTARTNVLKDVWETVSAFSNTSGGWIVLGVSQKKKTFDIVGVDLLNKASYKYFREYLKGFNPNLHYNTMDDDEFNQLHW
jgi:predicted HTH transcriptional regulator